MFSVAVGSSNPLKLEAVNLSMQLIFHNFCKVVGVTVDSGVSHQPIGRNETVRGAKNRALSAQKQLNSEFGVGLESGIEQVNQGLYCLSEYCYVIHRTGKESVGGGTTIPLPSTIVEMIHEGYELGDIMDLLTQSHGTKTKMGATGILTNNMVNRQTSYQMAIIYAFTPFIEVKVALEMSYQSHK